MLILSRRNGESIRIGDEVTITILQVKGGQIKIGINAPREVAVHREEVYRRLSEELPQNCVAANSNSAIQKQSDHNMTEELA